MSEPEAYSYPRYLHAKRSVDERSLSRRVWRAFINGLLDRVVGPVRILEVGAGVGATVERIIEALDDRRVRTVEYTVVDIEPANIAVAHERLATWASAQGLDIFRRGDRWILEGTIDVALRLVTADLFDYARSDTDSYDAIVAQAVLDLFPVSDVLDALRPLLGKRGLWYFPIHFDGITAFEPPVSVDLDAKIERLYHDSMSGNPSEEGGREGAHTGRRLLSRLREGGATLLEVGSSDWVVFAGEEGYPGDEAYFLHHILHFIEEELSGHPRLDADAFARWMDVRRRQIESGELVYVAHQLDVLGERGEESDLR